jgi:hypothetical protein
MCAPWISHCKIYFLHQLETNPGSFFVNLIFRFKMFRVSRWLCVKFKQVHCS